MRFKTVTLIAAIALSAATALPARAQNVKLRFHDGLVTLTAQNAPLRAILAEWARLGGTTVVNAERVAGAPLTLELNAVPEAQALATLLRNVSGYMAAARAAGTPGASVYDRVLILPTSSAPRNPAPAPGFQQPRPAIQRPPMIQPDPEPSPESEEEEEPPDFDEPPPTPIRPGMVGARPVPFPIPRPGVQPDPDDAAADDVQPDPDTEEAQPSPGNPFGVPTGGSTRPGVITPVPRAPQTPRSLPDGDP